MNKQASAALRLFFHLLALDYNPNEPRDKYGRWTRGYTDVTAEYRQAATPGKGAIEYEQGYDKNKNAAEVSMAQWLHDNLGGDIKLLTAANKDKQKTADYLWRGRLWDLKTISSEKAANSAVRHGIKQIEQNAGGIILNYTGNKLDSQALWETVSKRIGWYNPQGEYDVLLLSNGKLIAARRY